MYYMFIVDKLDTKKKKSFKWQIHNPVATS